MYVWKICAYGGCVFIGLTIPEWYPTGLKLFMRASVNDTIRGTVYQKNCGLYLERSVYVNAYGVSKPEVTL